MLGPYMLLISSGPSNGPYVLTGTGAFIVVFGLFGCVATCRGRPWMLKLYAVFLSLVFMTELIAGISGFIFRHEIKGTFLTTYSDAVMRYDGMDDRSLAVDGVQRRRDSRQLLRQFLRLQRRRHEERDASLSGCDLLCLEVRSKPRPFTIPVPSR
ncbi:tetraspanin-7-like [Scomber scombrus]|uniref:Tetraspanin-7-like n=1 Tax=Scomber scombrus TaxID=13677 RepID=A0AAV1Q5H3_SCOSC